MIESPKLNAPAAKYLPEKSLASTELYQNWPTNFIFFTFFLFVFVFPLIDKKNNNSSGFVFHVHVNESWFAYEANLPL